MIDDALIQGVQRVANYRLKKNFPLMGENHYSESDVLIILESLTLLLGGYDIQRAAESSNQHSNNARSKGVCKVPTK